MARRCAVLFLFLCVSCASAPPRPDTFDSLTALVAQTLPDHWYAGCGRRRRPRWQGRVSAAFGVSNQEAQTPMRTDTVFRIASLTKSCTGLAAAILAERGAVKLDAPIGGFATGLSPADAVVDAVAASQPLRRRAR